MFEFEENFREGAWPVLVELYGTEAVYTTSPDPQKGIEESELTIRAVRFKSGTLPGLSIQDLQPVSWAVSDQDVPSPKRGDTLAHNGVTWSVFGSSTKVANYFVLDAATNQR